MWMVLLYGVATFMETGVGVWMFGRMFPERKSSSEYRWAKMILLTLLILTTYTMHRAYGQEYIYEKFFFANYAQTECQFRYCGTAIPFLTVRSTAR